MNNGMVNEDHLMINSQQQLLNLKAIIKGNTKTIDLTKGTPLVPNNSNWVSFTMDHLSMLALSDDGKLWHAGPYPFKGKPSNFKSLLIPASQKLEPVFDFTTKKGF